MSLSLYYKVFLFLFFLFICLNVSDENVYVSIVNSDVKEDINDSDLIVAEYFCYPLWELVLCILMNNNFTIIPLYELKNNHYFVVI